jgi:hypothetical protein
MYQTIQLCKDGNPLAQLFLTYGKNVKSKWKGSDRINMAQDRHQWQAVVKMVMNILFVLFIPFNFCNLYFHQQNTF